MNQLRITIVGAGVSDIHEKSLNRGFIECGCETDLCCWDSLLTRKFGLLGTIEYQLTNRLLISPRIIKWNIDFIRRVIAYKPDLVFFYRPTHIFPSVLWILKRVFGSKTIIAIYNNDDAFSPRRSKLLWRNYYRNLKACDLCFVYRKREISLIKKYCVHDNIYYLPPWFDTKLHFYDAGLEFAEVQRVRSSLVVGFVGHYEPDGRLAVLKDLIDNGFTVKLYGPKWEWEKPLCSVGLNSLSETVDMVWDSQYRNAISRCDVALCFFSKLNRDRLTRRCFEIPAMRTVLLCEAPNDLGDFFEEGREFLSFTGPKDLLEKLRQLESDRLRIDEMAARAERRAKCSGNDEVARAKKVIKEIQCLITS